MSKIAIVIPVFNEEGNVTSILEELIKIFNALPEIEYEIIFVDDGSTDGTLSLIQNFSNEDCKISYISFSKNFGKGNALLAGYKYSKSDAVITLDADLQHPPSLIPELINWWRQGYDVVYAYRKKENHHAHFFTRTSSKLFYSTVNALSDVKMENGISDYKLIDKKVVKVINSLPEDGLFLRGIIKWVGFKQKPISYEPMKRHSGNTKYNLSSLIHLATHGLTSFSTRPLTFAIYLGFSFSMISLLYIPYVFLSFYYQLETPGWASIISTIVFFGGLQLMIMGIVGLYLGKTFIQSKHRPRYIIQSSNVDEID
jgi:dolichol-phosphate mannosyltransferase